MRIAVFLTFVLAANPLVAQQKMQILSADAEPKKMLYEFLRAEAQKHFDARRKVVAALKTPDEIHKRQAELKAKFIEAIGGYPDKTPLNPVVTGGATLLA